MATDKIGVKQDKENSNYLIIGFILMTYSDKVWHSNNYLIENLK